jgi:hypothetical protein
MAVTARDNERRKVWRCPVHGILTEGVVDHENAAYHVGGPDDCARDVERLWMVVSYEPREAA